MSQQRPRAEFSDVDHAGDPDYYVGVLNRQHAMPFKRLYKERTLTLLNLWPGLHMLEVGAGVGLDALEMARRIAPEGAVVGLDFSETMVREAQRRCVGVGLPVSFTQGDAHALPFDTGAFDRCYADRTFQHLHDPRQALAEMIRVTRPGGMLLIVEPDHEMHIIDTPFKDVTRRFLSFRSDTFAQGDVAHQLYGMMRELGLEDVAVEAMTDVETNYEALNPVMHLDGGMRVAAEQGIVTSEETERWIAYVEDAARAGRFFSATTYFITMGRKPA